MAKAAAVLTWALFLLLALMLAVVACAVVMGRANDKAEDEWTNDNPGPSDGAGDD